jgi:hypothetical protein
MRLVTSLRWLALVLCFCLALPGTAFAQTDEERAESERLAQEGTSFFQARNFEEAAIAFQEAYNLAPHPVVLFNLARAHQEMGDLPTALRLFRDVLGMQPDTNTGEAAQRRLTAIEDELRAQGYDPATLTAQDYVPRGSIAIESEPVGAQVMLDGTVIGVTPLQRGQIDQGTHEMLLTLEGYHPVTTTVDVRGGGETIRSFTMQPRTSLEEYVPPEPGYLSVNAPRSNMEVFVDGQRYSVTPLVQAPLAPGTYEIVVNAPGWRSYSTLVEVASGEQVVINATMEPVGGYESVRQGTARTGIANGLMIGGGGLVTVGTVFGVLALTSASSYNDRVQDPDRGSYRSAARTNALIADIGIGTGAALLVTGLVLRLTDRGDRSDGPMPEGLVFAPFIGRRDVGFALQGSF